MTDKELEPRVRSALRWEPDLDMTDIAVSVDEGVVTLRGHVASFPEKTAAERVAMHVYGVKAVVNDLIVRLASGSELTDPAIAQAAAAVLNWNRMVPVDRVTVRVANGWITLSGTVNRNEQKDAADRTVWDLPGVRGVTNNIIVQPRVKTTDVRDKIEAAFKRSAEIDARGISITTQDGKVILSGNVHSWAERQEAERAARAAPGVKEVEDHLAVLP